MDKRLAKRSNTRKRRVMRVRSKVRGSESRPRLCVHKSNSHIDAQLINDEESITLVSVSTLSKELKETENLFESLMGKKAEYRFKFIQENANFTDKIDI